MISTEDSTPEELFRQYRELQNQEKTCSDSEYEQVFSDKKQVVEALKSKGYVVAWHPNDGSFLCPV